MSQESTIKERKEVSPQYYWDVESMYGSWEEWKKEFAELVKRDSSPKWQELAKESVDLTTASGLKKALDDLMRIDCSLSALYTYAHLRHDEDVADDLAKKSYMEAMSAIYAFQEESSWFVPALLQQNQELLSSFLQAKELEEYYIYLEKIIRLKPYTLSDKEEKLIAFADKALETGHRAFSSLNNADLQFPSCLDEQGKSHELTHGTYQLYLRGRDRTLRKAAFTHLHQTFAKYENTLCDLVQGEIQKHVFYKKARGYSSCLEAALYPNQVDVEVYHSLVKTVRSRLSFLHDYIALRKKALGYDELHLYDLSVPMVSQVDIKLSYEEAVDCLIESVSPLGEEYQEILRKGMLQDRWVDRYENKRKRSGAYSSGCFTSKPYILLNYHGTFQDVMTLAHEAGHSMHSYFSAKKQKYQDHRYPIFLAEVASTFHEELLFQHFMKKADSIEKKAYLINQKIDDIRGTLFRQTMFAEFELALHEKTEMDIPLTPSLLKEEYVRLCKEYFGPSVSLDTEISAEWSRIPHFYYNFYVYQYATGISAAHALAEKVLKKEKGASEQYLAFISSGSSKDPIETLLDAGVDMRTEAAVDRLLVFFQELTRELSSLLQKIKS
jgi:oligoendopeptidase F